MGVDFYACGICGDTFPDCGEYGTCAKCEENICSSCHDEQLGKYGSVDEDSDEAMDFGDDALCECDLCSDKVVHDSDILNYLLKYTSLTKDDVILAVKKEKGIVD